MEFRRNNRPRAADFGGVKQQDSEEFLEFLMANFHDELNVHRSRTRLATLTEAEEATREKMPIAEASRLEWKRYEHTDLSRVSTLFHGQYASRVTCRACHGHSTTWQTFPSLSLNLVDNRPTTIERLLESWTMIEGGVEGWKCPNCKTQRPSTRKITLTRCPDYSIVHLIRHRHDGHS